MILVLFALVITFMGARTAHAQQGTLANDCAADIKTYCANVLPGGDRVVACLIAYEDKISPRCRLIA
jgi:hypothetical protein